MLKKCRPLWREAHFEVKMVKAPHVRTTFGRWSVVSCGRRKGFCTFPKVSKTRGFVAVSKTLAGVGHFEEDLRRCISHGRCSTRDMFIRDVRRSGPWFPERGCILEDQIVRFAKMISRDRCNTSYGLASFFRGRRSTLDKRSGKTTKRIGTSPSALHSALNFPFFKEVSQTCFVFDVVNLEKLASFSTLSSSKIEEVSQTCCASDVVKVKNWGSLAE